MFNVTKDKNYWYLTVANKGEESTRIVKFANLNEIPTVHLGFKTKVKALGCARQLNKEYWKDFKSSQGDPKKMGKQATAMLETICKHMESA